MSRPVIILIILLSFGVVCYLVARFYKLFSALSKYKRGMYLARQGKLDKALTVYDKALEIDPSSPLPLIGKGMIFYATKRHKEALKCFDRAIELNPYLVEVWLNKGKTLAEIGDEKGLECFEKAIELDPNSIQAYACKGLSLHYLGRNEEAVKCYDKLSHCHLFETKHHL